MPKAAKRNRYDIAVLGAGPAGLAAAIYSTRYNLKTVVFDLGYGRSTWFQNYSNYVGFPGGVAAMKFRDLGRRQAEQLGVKFHMEEPAERVTRGKGGAPFKVKTKKRAVTAEAVVVATGVEDVMPEFKDNVDYEGRSMYWCILCDGHYVNGQRVLCVGKDDKGVSMTLRLRPFTRRLTFVAEDLSKISPRELNKLKREKIPVYEGMIESVAAKRKGFVKSVTLELSGESEKILPTDAIFHNLGIQPYSDVAKKLKLKMDERGLIKVNPNTQETSLRDVYAVGDIRSDTLHQVHSATYSGTRAVIAANARLYAERFKVR